MLAHRVIPLMLIRGDSLVKGVGFDSWRSVGHPLQAIKVHQAREVDELMVIDISATPEGRGPDFKMVERLTRDSFTPLTVGGGVCTWQDVRDLLNAGADKVLIETAWMLRPRLIEDVAGRFGRQVVVAGVTDKGDFATSHCGRVTHVLGTVEAAVKAADLGAGEILLQSVERDGKMDGYDLELIAQAGREVPVPIVASCGCGDYSHMVQAVMCGASAVAAGAFFQFTSNTPRGASEALLRYGIEARMPA